MGRHCGVSHSTPRRTGKRLYRANSEPAGGAGAPPRACPGRALPGRSESGCGGASAGADVRGCSGPLFAYVDLPDDATLATGESLTVTYTFSVATDET